MRFLLETRTRCACRRLAVHQSIDSSVYFRCIVKTEMCTTLLKWTNTQTRNNYKRCNVQNRATLWLPQSTETLKPSWCLPPPLSDDDHNDDDDDDVWLPHSEHFFWNMTRTLWNRVSKLCFLRRSLCKFEDDAVDSSATHARSIIHNCFCWTFASPWSYSPELFVAFPQ